MDRKIGLSSRRAAANASSPQGYQSTGFWACCRRYGLFSDDRRLGTMCYDAFRGTAGARPSRRMRAMAAVNSTPYKRMTAEM